jgi:myo-inositol-1(or 4)-monophosphatase
MNTEHRDLDRTLEVAQAIAREAGRKMLSSYRQDHAVIFKGEVDLVTQVDLDCEALIRRRLAEHFPDDAILAEEGGATGDVGAARRWIVDPLDGTTNFAHGHPFFSVSIALELEGVLSVGVVHAPVLSVTWSARRGGGVWRNEAPARVSRVESLLGGLCASGFPYDRRTNPDNNADEWGTVLRRCQGVRRCGSAAMDLAMVADGTIDGYWEKRLNPWDMAAGVLLVQEAGGRCEGLDGSPIPPWPKTIVASNGLIHDELVEILTPDPV